jgi:hypothetical protein
MKITLKPKCLIILFTTTPYRAKRRFKLASFVTKTTGAARNVSTSVTKQQSVARNDPRSKDSIRLARAARHKNGTSANRDMNPCCGCTCAMEISRAEIPAQRKLSRNRLARSRFSANASMTPPLITEGEEAKLLS